MFPPSPVQLVWKNWPRGLVQPLVGVRAEIVALRLQKVGGQAFGGVAVEIAQRRTSWPAPGTP